MTLLEVNKLGINFGFGPIFEDLSFAVNEGDRLSIVGQNGSGKTTLLNIIAGIETADEGTVGIKKGTTLAFLQQTTPDTSDDRIVYDILKTAFARLFEKEKALHALEEEMQSCSDETTLETLVNRYGRQSSAFIDEGGYEIENSIAFVTNGLKIPNDLLEQNYSTLSGGEKTLVHFAQILLSKPDLLLLDEPTNHLDIERIEWLESYIQKFKGTVVTVSHDRYFLDKISEKVFEIENKTGTLYHGNYTSFLKQKEENELRVFEQFKNQQKLFAAMEASIKRFRDWGEQGDNPSFFKRAACIEKRLNLLKETAIEKPKVQKALPINFVAKDRSSNDVVRIKDFSISLGNKILLDNASVEIHFEDKVSLIGNNGTGKTTLIRAILGQIDEYLGTLNVGPNIKVGYLPQILSFEKDKETVLSYFQSQSAFGEMEARKILSKFQFYKDDVFKTVGNLSGGEKIRIKLACLLQREVNTLIFDEPTNHIDILTREVLEETLTSFKGPVIFVSHDRYFINAVANRVIEINNKKLVSYYGNYDDYKAFQTKKNLPPVQPKKIEPPKAIHKQKKWMNQH